MKPSRLLAALVLPFFLASGPAMADLKIGVAMAQFDDAWLTYLRESMVARAKADPAGVTLQFEDARADVVRQLSQVESFISQKVDAIIVAAVDTAAVEQITRAVTGAGIPLVYVNRAPEDAQLPKGVAVVVSDELEAGRLQMQYLADKMAGQGNIVILLGDLANNATTNRTKGAKEILGHYPGIKVVQEQTGVWLRDRGMTLVNDWLTQGRQFNAVIANNDEMAIGAVMALKQAGVKPGSVWVAGVDGTPDALNAIRKGELAASVFQDAKGQADGAVDVAVKMASKQPYEPRRVIPFQLITPDNVENFR
ncbi:sugar ABC transporter substrate-binding protein [Pseudomonas sp. UBA4194]|uniref:sugar ABC transporter substrate-binding protein n=1 Tax=Pseudomonas sp. UBA4194 TaxID=1947317 RepID=UPI0025D33834|nr:sugar ABC transporter substrate-binding protein [Pseudomonas sp. UBA4194]